VEIKENAAAPRWREITRLALLPPYRRSPLLCFFLLSQRLRHLLLQFSIHRIHVLAHDRHHRLHRVRHNSRHLAEHLLPGGRRVKRNERVNVALGEMLLIGRHHGLHHLVPRHVPHHAVYALVGLRLEIRRQPVLVFHVLVVHHLVHRPGHCVGHLAHHVVGVDRLQIPLYIFPRSRRIRGALGHAAQSERATNDGGNQKALHKTSSRIQPIGSWYAIVLNRSCVIYDASL